MTKRAKTIVLIAVFLLICISAGIVKFIGYEKRQIDRIAFLESEVTNLWHDVNSLKDDNIRLNQELSAAEKRSSADYSEDTFNYLAIGNSILWHETNAHWWNEIGMAASTADKDYFHIVLNYLKDIYGKVDAKACVLAAWEMQYYDRSETLQLLDAYLSSELNLVTVQLGENANDGLENFEEEYIELLKYIKAGAPNAQIIVVGDFFEVDGRDEAKISAANICNAEYADLSAVRGNPEYQCGMGTIVYDADGNPHEIDYIGIAGHPGDKGMLYIADAIIKQIK